MSLNPHVPDETIVSLDSARENALIREAVRTLRYLANNELRHDNVQCFGSGRIRMQHDPECERCRILRLADDLDVMEAWRP